MNAPAEGSAPRLHAPWVLAGEGDAEMLLVCLRQLRQRHEAAGHPSPTLHLQFGHPEREPGLRQLTRALGLTGQVRWQAGLEDWDPARDVLVLLGPKPPLRIAQGAIDRGVPVLSDLDEAFLIDRPAGTVSRVDKRRPDLVTAALEALLADRSQRAPMTEPPAEPAEVPPAPDDDAARFAAPAVVSGGLRLSVVVPSYQQAGFLRATLDSILAEAESEEVEVLVFDGGSTDGSVDILREYDGRIFWVSQRDGGQADAINQGLRRATGGVLAYLNSDDVYLPGALGRVARHFRDEPASRVAYGRAHHLRADGTYLEDYPTEPWDWARLLEVCFLCQPAVFWRREVLERFGTFEAGLHYAMDYEYWLRVGRAQPFTYLDDLPALAGSRLHEATKTLGSRVPVHREIVQVVQRYAGHSAPVHRWLGHLAHCRVQLEMPVVTAPAQRRLFALRWSAHVLRDAADLGIPFDAALHASVERHLQLNGFTG